MPESPAKEVLALAESKADLLFHPVRMRVIQALVGGVRMTSLQLSERLSDTPPATLYRHIRRLLEAGILTVVEERRIRGAVEKVYALPARQGSLMPDDMAHATSDDHMRYFVTFAATLMGDFGRYLQQERIDLYRDGVGYRQVPLYLSDAEMVEMTRVISAGLMPYLKNGPAPGRRRRTLTTIMIPDPDDQASTGGETHDPQH